MKWCLTGLCLLLAAPAVATAKASLTTPVVAVDGSQVTVSFDLLEAFDESLVDRIESGLPTGFDFKLKLVRPRSRWFDNTLESHDLQVVAMYNAVSREYLVNFKQDGKLTESRVVRDLDELRHAMTRFSDLPVFTIDASRPHRRVVVRLRAILGSHNILAFIPTKTHTEWVESRTFPLP